MRTHPVDGTPGADVGTAPRDRTPGPGSEAFRAGEELYGPGRAAIQGPRAGS